MSSRLQKKGTEIKPNISPVLKKDSSGRPIPNSCDGTAVRIRLFDDRERVLFFKDNQNPTARQVCEMTATKLDLAAESSSLFSLWIVSTDLELQIRPKMELYDMVAKWPRYMEKYTHHTADAAVENNPVENYKLIFKREAMVTKSDEEQCQDPVALKLLYGEARNNVMNGRYPLNTVDQAVEMGALQAYVSHGDYMADKHGPSSHFISQSLVNLIPKYQTNKIKSTEWEIRIAQKWEEIAQELRGSEMGPHKKYLSICRKWGYYGGTYFAACKNVPPSGYFELRSDHLWVAVSTEGLTIMDDDRHKMGWYGAYDGISWECTTDSITIEYTAPATPNVPSKRMRTVLITPQAHLIDSLASRAVYNIERAERRLKRAKAGNVIMLQAPVAKSASIKGAPMNAMSSNGALNSTNAVASGPAAASTSSGKSGTSKRASEQFTRRTSNAVQPSAPPYSAVSHDDNPPVGVSRTNSSATMRDLKVEATRSPKADATIIEEAIDPAEYMKAIKEVRSQRK